jgi:peptide/nickel transport system substrate-binding protein
MFARNHVRTAVVAVGAVLVTTLAACSSSSSPATTTGDSKFVSGGTFRKAIGADPKNLNPFKMVDLDGWEMITYAYESLVYVTPDGDFVPWLADSWTESGTKVTYKIRDGITCSDGTPFTAETAANNINYNTDPANATFYYGSQVTEAVSARADGDTLTVVSTVNDPFLMANTGTILMVCQAGVDDPEGLAEKTDGTGLFVLTDVKAGDTYSFTKRDDYDWGPPDGDGGERVTSDTVGLPDALEIRVIADESTTTNLMLSGDLNAAVVLGPDRARLDAAGLKYAGVRNSVGEMLFNERSDRVFADERVREALTLALNRDEIGDVVANGVGVPAVSLVTKSPLLCVQDPPSWTLPDTDLERAAELLDAAGWTLGSDGKRSKDGKPLEVKFIYDAATSTHAPAAELIKQTWDALGVTTDLHANDAADWSEKLFQSFDWDTGFAQIAPGSPMVLSTFFAGADPEDDGLNFMFVDNPEYNELVEQAKRSSPQEACGLWQQAESALIDRVDVFPLIDNILPTYQSGAVFDRPNYLPPTSIRMLG